MRAVTSTTDEPVVDESTRRGERQLGETVAENGRNGGPAKGCTVKTVQREERRGQVQGRRN